MPDQKQMYDSKAVIVGLVIFVAIATLPFWYNHLKAAPAPELVLTKQAQELGLGY